MFETASLRIAAVQDAPVYMNAAATVEKVIALMGEAKKNKADLVVFPETFIPGYPYWNWLIPPPKAGKFFKKLAENALEIDGEHVLRLRAASRELGIHLVIGITERSPQSIGCLYNSVLRIDDSGKLAAVHRKISPSWAEKLTWTPGDGLSLRTGKIAGIPVGSLICAENNHPLVRHALYQQGELLRTAHYISFPLSPGGYTMADLIRNRSSANAIEGKQFVVVSSSAIDEDMIRQIAEDIPEAAEQLARPNSAYTGIFGPSGAELCPGLLDEKGICYAELNFEDCIAPRQLFDPVGTSGREDVVRLWVKGLDESSAGSLDGLPAELPAEV